MAFRKRPHRVEQCFRGFDLRQVPAISQQLELRTRYRMGEHTAVRGIGDLVAVTPDTGFKSRTPPSTLHMGKRLTSC